MSFDGLGLSAELLRALRAQGYQNPTPIQKKSIPAVLSGNDVMGAAQTGTGKTAGFTLPLLQRLASQPASNKKRRSVRGLILTPTRELAAQVADSVRCYGRNLPLKSAAVFGGVKINPQISKLKQGVDILIATPGRLLDHIQQGTVNLSGLEILVLDEADRMLDMGFIQDIRKILTHLPDTNQRQTLMFSATFSKEIKSLSRNLLNNPKLIEVAPQNKTADKIQQSVHLVDKNKKSALLRQLLKQNDWQQVLVFTRTKHGANKLAEVLKNDGFRSAAIHGNKTQAQRTRALADFKKGKLKILVATDIAARGLDIDQLPNVVNFELPNVPEDYVHRIGRTARAGRSGQATSLVSVDEYGFLRQIERLINQQIEQIEVEGFEPTDRPSAQPRKAGGNNKSADKNKRRKGPRAGKSDEKKPNNKVSKFSKSKPKRSNKKTQASKRTNKNTFAGVPRKKAA